MEGRSIAVRAKGGAPTQGGGSGFTMMEILAVVAILSVLLALAGPDLSATLKANRIQATLHLLATDIAFARSEAIMRRADVVACPGRAAGGCALAGDWSSGWIIFEDLDHDRRPDDPLVLIRIGPAPAPGTVRVLSNRPYVRYQPDGRAGPTNLTITSCSEGRIVGQLVINNAGRLRAFHGLDDAPCPA